MSIDINKMLLLIAIENSINLFSFDLLSNLWKYCFIILLIYYYISDRGTNTVFNSWNLLFETFINLIKKPINAIRWFFERRSHTSTINKYSRSSKVRNFRNLTTKWTMAHHCWFWKTFFPWLLFKCFIEYAWNGQSL